MFHPSTLEVKRKCQDAFMDEQGAPDWTQTSKGSTHVVAAQKDGRGGKQQCCPELAWAGWGKPKQPGETTTTMMNYSTRNWGISLVHLPLSLWKILTSQARAGEFHTKETNRSWKLLKHMEDNFLVQGLREPPRTGALPALLFVNREGLRGEMVTGGCLDHSDHEVVVFQ